MEEFFDYGVRGAKSKYRRKPLEAGGAYHVFNRREDDLPMFVDDIDRQNFVEIMRRLLDPVRFRDERGRALKPTHGNISLQGYSLLTTHYHLCIEHELRESMTRFMRRLQISYTKRFNNRHGLRGPMFAERYQAVPIEDAFHHKMAIAYVHANPGEVAGYAWTGHEMMLDKFTAGSEGSWFDARRGLEVYGGLPNYQAWFDRAVEARRRRNG